MKPEILLLGCGNMGGALLSGWLKAGYRAQDIVVVDPVARNVPPSVRHVGQAGPDIAPPDILVLAVKPQMLAQVAPVLARLAGPHTMVLSILAAVEFAPLRAAMPHAGTIVRAVPNLPASIGMGITAMVADRDDDAVRARMTGLVETLGPVEWLAEEWECDAVTAVSGCGPAFLFRFADATMKAGQKLGLAPDLVQRLVERTLTGSAALLQTSKDDAGTLASRVASPGGVTLAGLAVLDEEDALASLLERTLDAANRRSEDMARDYR